MINVSGKIFIDSRQLDGDDANLRSNDLHFNGNDETQ